jgi:ABC-type branched-subunit amino acid transport system substrate-binding protein
VVDTTVTASTTAADSGGATTTPPDAAATSAAGDTTAPETGTPTTDADAPADDRAFKVMVIGDETSQISFTVAEAVPAVEAAFAGLPNVEVLHCDSAGDSNVSQECQREAVDEGVAIVIGSFGQIGSDVTVLNDAGIPAIGGVDPASPNSFSLSAGLASYAGLGVAAGEAECTTIATLFLDGADFLANMVQQGAELQGATEVARSGIPQNTPDIAPQVAALTGVDADCIILSVTPTQVIQAVTALNQAGVTAQLIGVGAIFPPEVVEQLGDLAEGIITSEIQINPADDDPALEPLRTAMAEIDPDAPVTTLAVLSWAAANLIIDALPAIDGDVTPAALTAALQGLEDAPGGGVVHPVTMEDLASPTFPRFYNPWGLLYRIEDGQPVRLSEDYFSLRPVLEAVKLG